jgi:hypothetical protein
MDFYRYIALIAAFALAVTLFISPFLRNSPNSRPETCRIGARKMCHLRAVQSLRGQERPRTLNPPIGARRTVHDNRHRLSQTAGSST